MTKLNNLKQISGTLSLFEFQMAWITQKNMEHKLNVLRFAIVLLNTYSKSYIFLVTQHEKLSIDRQCSVFTEKLFLDVVREVVQCISVNPRFKISSLCSETTTS